MDCLNKIYTFATGGVPSYTQTLYDIKWAFEYCYANCTESESYSPVAFFGSLKKYAVFDTQKDLSAIAIFAVLWTLLRYVLTVLIFEPAGDWLQLKERNKFPESAWKLLVYTFTWSLTCYVIFGIPQNNHIFYEPDTLWKDHAMGMPIDTIVYIVYMLQLSFYVHSIYASFHMDVWRHDSALMVFHHFLTISLIGFSYTARYHKVGLLVLFVHDVTDVALEFTKCNVYLKNRGGRFYRFNDILSNIGFVMFAACWYLFRLYWLPLKVLHSTGYGAMMRHKESGFLPFYFFFNTMIWILQIMNVYWFMYIINFMVKVATGQMDQVDDIREEGVAKEKVKPPKHFSSMAHRKANGGGQQRVSPRTRAKKAD